MVRRRKRAFLLSCSIILLCVSMVVGGTYALLTERLVSTQHLKAGDLKVTLTRDKLEYTRLTADGVLEVVTNDTDVDFSKPTTDNIFGITEEMQIVPGSYFQTGMLIKNSGDIAFDYSIQIQMNTGINAFAEQLVLTITDEDGKEIFNKKLSELTTAQSIPCGTMKTTDKESYFTVRLSFPNLDSAINNAAQGQEAKFDLIVTATQLTATTTAPNS